MRAGCRKLLSGVKVNSGNSSVCEYVVTKPCICSCWYRSKNMNQYQYDFYHDPEARTTTCSFCCCSGGREVVFHWTGRQGRIWDVQTTKKAYKVTCVFFIARPLIITSTLKDASYKVRSSLH